MDPRTPSEVEATGTLPFAGEGTVSPLTEEEPTAAAATTRPEWVDEARAGLTVPGKYLAYEDAGRRVVAPVSREWTRIGRSLSADIRFDDATVSRRHALVVNQADGVRVLDDRSLNGVFVNGERVDWAPLSDGDEIAIGRHTIHFFDTATVGSSASGPPATVAE
jgi:pSer/pThr/pTyr-binding forkhead associated (FHA) protein